MTLTSELQMLVALSLGLFYVVAITINAFREWITGMWDNKKTPDEMLSQDMKDAIKARADHMAANAKSAFKRMFNAGDIVQIKIDKEQYPLEYHRFHLCVGKVSCYSIDRYQVEVTNACDGSALSPEYSGARLLLWESALERMEAAHSAYLTSFVPCDQLLDPGAFNINIVETPPHIQAEYAQDIKAEKIPFVPQYKDGQIVVISLDCLGYPDHYFEYNGLTGTVIGCEENEGIVRYHVRVEITSNKPNLCRMDVLELRGQSIKLLPIESDKMLKYFEIEDDLRLHPRLTSFIAINIAAHTIVETMQSGPERTVALRKLLECQDCIKRCDPKQDKG